MDVTPQELRDIEIREAWRGYHRDDVDELLERAAATIEHYEASMRGLQERLAGAPARALSRPEPPAPAQIEAAPSPAPAPRPEPARIPIPDSDVIQRTLLLAQRAADEAVAEAQARARQLVAESEAKAQSLVSEAESTARRIAESERIRIEAEIQQLTSTRDALLADVGSLERFGGEYRQRIVNAVQAELDRLGTLATPVPPVRPTMRSLEPERPAWQPAPAAELAPAAPPPAPIAAEAEPEPEPDRAPAEAEGFSQPPPAWETTNADANDARNDTTNADATAAATAAANAAATVTDLDVERAPAWDDRSEPDLGAGRAEGDAPAPAPLDSLDDDAFFASLRDAVRDDSPLGNRSAGGFYEDDDDDPEAGRKLFRRRR